MIQLADQQPETDRQLRCRCHRACTGPPEFQPAELDRMSRRRCRPVAQVGLRRCEPDCDGNSMTDQQSKLCNPHPGNPTTYFLERAKHYRFAAAMTENTHEIERLCEVAHMFERMARDTRRLAPRSRMTAGAWPRRQCSLSIERKGGLIETWVGRVARSFARDARNGCSCCCNSHFFERLSVFSRRSSPRSRSERR
jgi:hypothetical protein